MQGVSIASTVQAQPRVSSTRVALRVQEKLSWPTVALTVGVLLVNYLPVLLFVPIGTALKFGIVIALLLVAWISGVRSGVLGGQSDRYAPYVLFLAYYIYVMISMIMNGKYVNNTLTVFGVVVMQPLIVFSSIMLRDRKRSFVIVMTWASGILFVMMIYMLIFRGDFSDIRIGETYQNVNLYLGIFAVLLYSMESRRLWITILAKIISFGAIVLMLMVGGRASVVSVFIVFVIQSFYLSKRKGIQLIILIVAVMFVFALWSQIEETRFFQRMTILASGDDSSKRIYLFTSALELFKQNPLWGAGINAFPVFINKFEEGWYPHNIFLDILCSLGIVGFILFSSYIIYCIYEFIKYRNIIDNYNIQAFAVSMYILITYQFVGELVAAWMLYLALGMSLPNTQITMARITSGEPSSKDLNSA
ncbi:MAG: O-antigen ligase family protein [Rhodothermales bacterium]|nr:O-antigen ligase family protein [Rhodothermales bacterium]